MDTFPDLGSLSDQELKDLIQQLTEEEVDISYKRRILHGKIDILRAELVNRLRKKHETGEIIPVELEAVVATEGAALVIRTGGRVGESFPLQGERMTIGRRPDADVFLDDVTVSREHATLVRRGGGWYLDDAGSLNGTYVNRQRVDSHRLADGDELQIGKFKLTFFAR